MRWPLYRQVRCRAQRPARHAAHGKDGGIAVSVRGLQRPQHLRAPDPGARRTAGNRHHDRASRLVGNGRAGVHPCIEEVVERVPVVHRHHTLPRRQHADRVEAEQQRRDGHPDQDAGDDRRPRKPHAPAEQVGLQPQSVHGEDQGGERSDRQGQSHDGNRWPRKDLCRQRCQPRILVSQRKETLECAPGEHADRADQQSGGHHRAERSQYHQGAQPRPDGREPGPYTAAAVEPLQMDPRLPPARPGHFEPPVDQQIGRHRP